MKTTTDEQTTQNPNEMKTTIMSIPTCAASYTLKELGEKKIACEYMGVDSSGRILMQIAFEANLQEVINELSRSMEEIEKAMTLFFDIVGIAIKNAALEKLPSKPFRRFKRQTINNQAK